MPPQIRGRSIPSSRLDGDGSEHLRALSDAPASQDSSAVFSSALPLEHRIQLNCRQGKEQFDHSAYMGLRIEIAPIPLVAACVMPQVALIPRDTGQLIVKADVGWGVDIEGKKIVLSEGQRKIVCRYRFLSRLIVGFDVRDDTTCTCKSLTDFNRTVFSNTKVER